VSRSRGPAGKVSWSYELSRPIGRVRTPPPVSRLLALGRHGRLSRMRRGGGKRPEAAVEITPVDRRRGRDAVSLPALRVGGDPAGRVLHRGDEPDDHARS
jgi:hypothetical protein